MAIRARILVVSISVFSVVLAGFVAIEAEREARDRALYPAPGQMVDVGGRRLHLWCEGTGEGPTVVMLSGGGIPAVASYGLQDRIARFARVCSYDRAGLGWSEPSPRPMSLGEQTADLDRLLSSGGVAGPIILAPESFGALIAIDYARQHPGRVVGIVFIDGAEPNTWFDAMRHENTTQLRLKDWTMQTGCRLGIARLLLPLFEPAWVNRLPGRIRGQFREVFSRPNSGWGNALNAYENTARAQRPSFRAGSLGAIPIIVIRHGAVSTSMSPAFERAWPQAQRRLAGLTTGQAVAVVATNGGHDIAQEQPELVAEMVRRIVFQ